MFVCKSNYDVIKIILVPGANLIRHPAGLYSMYEATDIKTATLNGAEYIVSANQGVIKRYSAVELGTAEFDESRTARTVAMGK